jgi:hypothetical protein
MGTIRCLLCIEETVKANQEIDIQYYCSNKFCVFNDLALYESNSYSLRGFVIPRGPEKFSINTVYLYYDEFRKLPFSLRPFFLKITGNLYTRYLWFSEIKRIDKINEKAYPYLPKSNRFSKRRL